MKRNRFLLLIIIILMSFFLNKGIIEAKEAKSEAASLSMKNVSGNCSDYFSIRSTSEYEHEVRSNAKAKAEYAAGKLKGYIFVNGNNKWDSDKEFDSTDTVTTAWYFITEKKGVKFQDNAKLTIDVYAGSNKVCTAHITGFNKSKDNVKVTLKHDGIIQSVTLKGSFTNGTNTVTDELSLKIVKSTSKTELNTEKGTRKGVEKQDVIQTNEKGEIINTSKTSCTDVRDLIHDYWSYVMVIAPILLIVMMTLDFFKAIGSNDADAIKKAGTNAVKRTLAAVILLALPALLGVIFDIFGLPLCI